MKSLVYFKIIAIFETLRIVNKSLLNKQKKNDGRI